MTNSILIGKVIYSLLSTNEELTTMLGEDKIYPIIADNDAKYPFLVYKRLSVSSIQTKDGFGEDLVSYEIIVVAGKYIESLNIANKVREILERQKIESNIMTLYNNKITNVSEEYSGDAYVQKLTFQSNIN